MAERPRIRTYFLSLNHQRICDTDDGLRRRAAALQAGMRRWYRDIGPVIGLLKLPGVVYSVVHEKTCTLWLWADGTLQEERERHSQEMEAYAKARATARASGWPDDAAPSRPRWTCAFMPSRGGLGEPPAHIAPATVFHFRAVGTEMFSSGMLAQLLPCLYAVLGALASMFRRLGQRVQAEALSLADHGGMRMTVILGVLAGAVIGLLVGQLQTMEGSSTLTLAGFALLAGYAVDRLFNLFDSLSARLFGEPATPAR